MRRSVTLWGPLRVAGIATGIVAAIYVVVAIGIISFVVQALQQSFDNDLAYRLHRIQAQVSSGTGPGRPGASPLGSMMVWLVAPDGTLQGTPGTPVLPPITELARRPVTISIDGTPYRLMEAQVQGGTLVLGNVQGNKVVLGEDVSSIEVITHFMTIGAVMIGVPLLLTVFGVAFWSGRGAAIPIEQARQRQLAFTADASHELRTPLQVIEAETSLALLRERPAKAYRETVERISHESARLHRIVDDLLWLARFQDEPSAPQSKVMDLREVASTALDRFQVVASQRGITLQVHSLVDSPPLVSGPPEWLERLAGVLVDNACRYTPDGGAIRIVTGVHGGGALLAVEDSGPGISPDQLARIFDRFYRASTRPGGAGLGLSIADSVVRATGGRWQVGRSPALGGAHFEVSWPLAQLPRGLSTQASHSPLPAPPEG
jgi:signal transduction histidine kinase